MSLLCRLGKHRPASVRTWNDGLHFSRCVACGVDLVRGPGQWRPAPPGTRVVWRERRPGDLAPSRSFNSDQRLTPIRPRPLMLKRLQYRVEDGEG